MNFDGLVYWLRPYAVWFYQWAVQSGLQPRITSVFRSFEKQRVLYDRYVRGESDLPAAPPGQSYHNYGRAFDMVTNNPEAAGRIWKQMGGRWWASDPVHFEI